MERYNKPSGTAALAAVKGRAFTGCAGHESARVVPAANLFRIFPMYQCHGPSGKIGHCNATSDIIRQNE